MSDTVQEAVKQACATIIDRLSAPYFFEKLAAHGIVPSDENEAVEMWTAAQKMHVLYTDEQQKTAAARHNGLGAINKQLDEVLANAGYTDPAQEKAGSFYDTAALAAEQPEIAEAILTLQAATAAAAQE